MTFLARDIDVYGVRLAIRSNERSVLEQLPRYLPIGWKPLHGAEVDRIYFIEAISDGSEHRSVYTLREGSRTLETTHDLDYALRMLEYDLELHVAEATPDFVFVHAGVVGWQGRALVIPGRSFSGKSTLVASLCHAGATYYSDEYALLDDEGRVHAYPRPLHLRRQVVDADELSDDALRLSSSRQPLPVGLVVLTHFQPGASWQPRNISRGQAILEVLTNTLPARLQPRRVLTVLQKAVATACVLQGPRGEVGEIRQSLLNGTCWHETVGYRCLAHREFRNGPRVPSRC